MLYYYHVTNKVNILKLSYQQMPYFTHFSSLSLLFLSEIVSTEPSLKLALECCERLCDLDKIRSKSWSRRFGKLQLLYSAVNEVKSCV